MNATAAQPLTFKRTATPEAGQTKYVSADGRYVIVGRQGQVAGYRGGSVTTREFVVERAGRRISTFAHAKLADAKAEAQRDAETMERAHNSALACERARVAGETEWTEAADGLIMLALAEDGRRTGIATVVATAAESSAMGTAADTLAPNAELNVCRHDRRPIARVRRDGRPAAQWWHVDGRGGRACADTATEATPLDPAAEFDRVSSIVLEEMPGASAHDVYATVVARLRRGGVTVRPLNDPAPAAAVTPPPARPTGTEAVAAVARIARRIDAEALTDSELMVLGLLCNRLGRSLDALANRRAAVALHARAAGGANDRLIAAHRQDVEQAGARYDAARLLLAEALMEYVPSGSAAVTPVHNGTRDHACTECGHLGNGQVPGCTCPGCDDVATWARAEALHARLGDPSITVQRLADYLAAGGTDDPWSVAAADLR